MRLASRCQPGFHAAGQEVGGFGAAADGVDSSPEQPAPSTLEVSASAASAMALLRVTQPL